MGSKARKRTTKRAAPRTTSKRVVLTSTEEVAFSMRRRQEGKIKRRIREKIGKRRNIELHVQVETFKNMKSQGLRTLTSKRVDVKELWSAYHQMIKRALRKDSHVAIITTQIVAVVRTRRKTKRRVRR